MRRLADDLGAPLKSAIKKRKLIISGPDKTMKIIEGDQVGKYVREVKMHDAIYSSPVVAQQVLYISTMQHLYAVTNQGE